MNAVLGPLGRRSILKGLAMAGAAGLPLARPAVAVPRPLKIGLVVPMTGPLALFSEHVPFVLDQVKRTYGGTLKVNGANHPFQIILKDSQSNPNRASEVALDLILKDKVDIMLAFATPETVNPVSDQCEANGVPCLSNDAPLEPWFFGRHGDPKKGFEWTYNFFFSADEGIHAFIAVWGKVSATKTLGVLWANDDDGNAFSRVMPPVITKGGFKIVDPGRFDLPASNFNAQIAAFKSGNADTVLAVLPAPDFTTFWNESARQAYHPRAVTAGKVAEFPPGVYPYGDRAINFSIEVWWSRFHPYSSAMTGQSSAQLADEYEKASGRQASMALGFRHSLLEVCFDVLKRSQDLDKPESIRDALRTTDYKSIVGPINFSKGPFPNTSLTPLVAGQWRKGSRWPLELVIVDNALAPEIPLGGHPEPMTYGS
ncbi:MAG TPA: ABC transporter substrate-binding protein [Acetobacteraceae bacterium]|nr:ABC transporter substrate-binding protein [Acetobacteraceae bacterium]